MCGAGEDCRVGVCDFNGWLATWGLGHNVCVSQTERGGFGGGGSSKTEIFLKIKKMKLFR